MTNQSELNNYIKSNSIRPKGKRRTNPSKTQRRSPRKRETNKPIVWNLLTGNREPIRSKPKWMSPKRKKPRTRKRGEKIKQHDIN